VPPRGSHLWFPGIPADCSPWPSAGGYLGSIVGPSFWGPWFPHIYWVFLLICSRSSEYIFADATAFACCYIATWLRL
jgi:hypothetical protein